jgi:putative NADH-flavin reductase
MKIVVFGATGPTGRLVLKQGLEMGLQLRAVARNPADLQITHPALEVVQGDVYAGATVARAIAGQDAVISVYGVNYSFKPITVYSEGIKNIISGMQQNKVQRLLCVTSGGTHPGYDNNAGFIFSVIIKGIIGRTLYADMRRLEKQVYESNLDWMIARPARLIDTPEVSDYQVGEGYSLPKGTVTRRADLANFLLKEAQNNSYVQKAVAIASY